MSRSQVRVGHPLRLNRLYLLQDNFKSVKLTADLGPQVFRQMTAIASLELFQPCAAVTAQRLVIADPLSE